MSPRRGIAIAFDSVPLALAAAPISRQHPGWRGKQRRETDGGGDAWITAGRLYQACRGLGVAKRCLDLAVSYAKQRVTFGAPLADRQTIQWWVADAATQIHACRLMVYDAACKIDRGRDARSEVSMIKVFATELAWDIIDKAMQAFGAMGMAKEIPLQLMASKVRLMRIYDGPSEVHRWVIARNLLGRR